MVKVNAGSAQIGRGPQFLSGPRLTGSPIFSPGSIVILGTITEMPPIAETDRHGAPE
jgi:hypothetical protein